MAFGRPLKTVSVGIVVHLLGCGGGVSNDSIGRDQAAQSGTGPATITSATATYGGELGAAKGNATPLVAKCVGKQSCDFEIDTSTLSSTSVVEGVKGFVATITCGSGASAFVRRVAIMAEANGETVALSCTD